MNMFSRRTLGNRPLAFRAPLSAFCLLIAAAFSGFCAAASAADAKPGGSPAPDSGSPDLNVQLEIETGRLEQMKQQLQQMEKYLKEGMQRRQDLSRDESDVASREQTLDNVPASVVSENLRVERAEAENGLMYTISARNVSLLQVLEAVSKTSALPLETRHVPQDRLLNRLWMNLNGVEMSELLRIAAGTQSLDAMADGDGIVVAPLSALSDRPVQKRLQELAVEAYQQALFKYPASAEAPAAYLGIARHYAANNFPTAAIQTAQNILDRWQKTSSAGGPAARDSADGDASVVQSALLLIGNCYEALREYDTARKTYYRYADLFPGAEQAPAAMVMIAETWIKEHKCEEAMPVLEETIRQWPKSDSAPFARMRLAECLSEQQHYDQAVAQLEIIEQNYASFPRRDELNLAMADCLIKLKQFGPARVRLKEVYEKSPDAALAERALYALGDSQLAEGNTVAALEVYRGAVSRFPEGALVRSGADPDGPGLSSDGALLQGRGSAEVAAGLRARARRDSADPHQPGAVLPPERPVRARARADGRAALAVQVRRGSAGAAPGRASRVRRRPRGTRAGEGHGCRRHGEGRRHPRASLPPGRRMPHPDEGTGPRGHGFRRED